jgi:uncharacterized RDD family membrane protein YckC
MARWTATWLQGPGVTLSELRGTWPGARLGLPEQGSGSVATFSVRAMGFFLDIVACALASGLLIGGFDHPTPETRQLVAVSILLVEQVVFVALLGQTLGMRLLGVKVLKLSDVTRPPGLFAAVARAVPLILTLGLAGFFTKDGRGAHDLLAGCVVVRD